MDRILNVRGDQADWRDKLYEPRVSFVPREIPVTKAMRLNVEVLDQGREGSCTGFGLATVIHYLQRQHLVGDTERVSARMLYEMAKRYDRWPGESYDGSSCRGALRGWHKHGVCTWQEWPYEDGKADVALTPVRALSAKARPLGAYQRVNKLDLSHMHAALHEATVLYVSVETHGGWDEVGEDGQIPFRSDEAGGHALAMVGYDAEGFWLHNSWGKGWGADGFARIRYNDWLRNAKDVWACQLGVPIRVGVRLEA